MPNIKYITKEKYEEITSIWEWDNRDYKSFRIKWNDLEKSIVAFANKDWWTIYIWIEEDKKKKEFKLENNKTIEDYNSHVSAFWRLKPPIYGLSHNFLSVLKENKKASENQNEWNSIFLEINIPSSNEVHSTSGSVTYVRVWAQNEPASAEQIKNLLDEKKQKQEESIIIQNIKKEKKNIKKEKIGNDFIYDFDKFSDSYWFILKCIERIKNNDFTEAENQKFYENISKNSNYIIHFFNNIWEVDSKILDELNTKLISPIIQSNKSYENSLSVISYLELYINSEHVNKVLDIFRKILKQTEDEFLFRKTAIILSKNKLKSFDAALMSNLVRIITEKWKRFSHDFIVEFLSKNIDKFSSYKIENIMNLFDFDWTWSDKLMVINSSIHAKTYLPDIFSKMLYIDYKLTFKYFGKLLNEGNKWSHKINWINYINCYSFSEVSLSSIYSLQEDIFILLWKELIKSWKDPKNRNLFEEVTNYIIEKGDYSIFYELISFALVKQKEKNINLIRKLVHKKEIYSFISIFQKRWGEEIFTYLFSKEDNYIEEFESYVIENEDKYNEHRQAYLLYTIPKSKLSKKWEQTISDFLSSNNWYKISFKSKPSFPVVWKQKLLFKKFKKREQLEDICKKSDLVLAKEEWWGLYDYEWIYKEYFKNNLDQVKEAYSYIASKWEEAYLLASMPVRWFLEHLKEKYKDSIDISFYKDLVDIYWVIEENDIHTKLEVWKLLCVNEFLKREFTAEISKENKDIYEWVKSIVLDLANSKDPYKDQKNNLIWLNTVRWLWTITSSILLSYYPDEEDLKTKISELSYDKLYGIQATLIDNIYRLWKDNRGLAKEILDKYIYNRNKDIDDSLVNCIGIMWYIENKDLCLKLLKWLLESEDKDIREKTWNLLWCIILNGLEKQNEDSVKKYREVLNNIISKDLWTHDAIFWIWAAMQNKIISIPESEVLEKEIDLITYILDNYKKPSWDENKNLYYRLSFSLFDKDGISPECFDIFYEKEVFQKIITKSKCLASYRIINDFLKEVLEKRWSKVVDKIKSLMKLQVDSNDNLFQPFEYTHLEDLLTIIYDKYNGKDCKICDTIFQKGLEISRKEEYTEIYNKYYKES